MPQQRQQWAPPAPPDEPVQEGARWRWHRPPSEAVAAWFGTQPLDDEMEHSHYVGGIVLIPQSEKVRYTKPDGSGTAERYEQVFTPYVQIGTRNAYFHRLAEARGLIPVIEPAQVPRTTNPASLYFNANLIDGLWWHVVQGDSGPIRYLCATARVAMYTPQSYMDKLNGRNPLPMRAGEGTKQVYGGADINQIAKAQTGAIGRALGVAGILVVGTGIATAEDMMELNEQRTIAPPQATLPGGVPSEIAPGEPPQVTPGEELAQLRSRAMALQTQMTEHTPTAWREFVAWWNERKRQEGWGTLQDVPLEPLRGVYQRMVQLHDAGVAAATSAAAAIPPNDETEVGS